jgi:hypothetical protein
MRVYKTAINRGKVIFIKIIIIIIINNTTAQRTEAEQRECNGAKNPVNILEPRNRERYP